MLCQGSGRPMRRALGLFCRRDLNDSLCHFFGQFRLSPAAWSVFLYPRDPQFYEPISPSGDLLTRYFQLFGHVYGLHTRRAKQYDLSPLRLPRFNPTPLGPSCQYLHFFFTQFNLFRSTHGVLPSYYFLNTNDTLLFRFIFTTTLEPPSSGIGIHLLRVIE